MRNVAAIAGSIVADALRRKVVYVVLLFGAVMAVAIPQLPSYGVGVVSAVYREVALALTYVAALVVVLSLSANRVPGEVERRTVYNVLSKSVRRWEYVVGTWLGIAVVMAGVIAGFAVISQLVGVVVYDEVMWRLWEGALAIWLETSVIAAFAVAVSAASGPVVVAVASLVFVFAAHARAGLFADPTALAARLYPSMDAFNVIAPVAHGDGVSAAYVGLMLLVFAAWSAALLVVGSLVFGRRDL